MTNIFRNWTQYTCGSVIQNGVEYNLGGWNCDEEIYKASMEANVFVPNSYTITRWYCNPWQYLPEIYYDQWDGMLNDTTYIHKYMFAQGTSAGVSWNLQQLIVIKQLKKDCTATTYNMASIYYRYGGSCRWCKTFMKDWDVLTSMYIQTGTSNYDSSSIETFTLYDVNLDWTYTETVLWSRDPNNHTMERGEFLTYIGNLYQTHLTELSATWWLPKEKMWVWTISFQRDTGSNTCYDVILNLDMKLYPPVIVDDNYIEFTTNAACTLPINTPVAVVLDGEDSSTYTDTNITIPAGNHSVKVIPYNPTSWWAAWFKLRNWVVSLTHDAPFSAYNVSDTVISDNYRKEFAKWCTTLTSFPETILNIPNTITTIGNDFMYGMFEWCTSLTTVPTIEIPNSVTAIWDGFMRRQYYGCTWLTTTEQESMSDNVTSIGNYFMAERFYWCTWLTINQQEYLWTSLLTIWNSFRESEYDRCTWLVETRDEVLPNTITSIWNAYRRYEFRQCNSITSVWVESLPDSITSIWTWFRYEEYISCTAITNIKWWKDLSIGSSSYRYSQFSWCNTYKTVKVLSDVWYNCSSSTLNNTYVSEVQVPNEYLNNFVNSNNYPRRSINDNKFVWY